MGCHATQPLLLGFGDAQAVKGSLDVIGHVVPVFLGGIRRAEEVRDIVEVDVVEFAAVAPVGHLALDEVMVGFDTDVGHPLGLVLERRNVSDHLLGEAFVEPDGGVLRVVEPKLVVTDRLSCFVAHVQASAAVSSHS